MGIADTITCAERMPRWFALMSHVPEVGGAHKVLPAPVRFTGIAKDAERAP